MSVRIGSHLNCSDTGESKLTLPFQLMGELILSIYKLASHYHILDVLEVCQIRGYIERHHIRRVIVLRRGYRRDITADW